MKSLNVYLLAIFFITLNLRGQNVHFKNLNRQDGLSDNFVRVIYEDNYGYMWFGTTNGLNRFDGVEMKQFKRIVGDESSLAEANINDILQTSSNKLLVGYNSGLDVYNYKREDFAKIEELKGVVVSKIVEDDVGNIWIVTGNNLMLKFDKNLSQVKDFSFSTIIKNKFNISTSSLNVYKYDDDNFIIYILNKGIYLFNVNSHAFTLKSNFIQLGSKPNKVLKINESEFWLATSNGIFVIENNDLKHHIKQGKSNKDLNNPFVRDLRRVGSNEIWVFTDGGGINVYNLTSKNFKYIRQNARDEYSVTSNFLYSSFISKDSTLWVGSIKNGVSQLIKNNPFITYKLRSLKDGIRSDYPVSSLFLDENNRIWVGSDGNGLYYYEKGIIKHVYSDENIKTIPSINEYYPGHLLLGTYKNGLHLFDIRNKKVEYQSVLHKSINPTFKVSSIVKDVDDNLIINSSKSVRLKSKISNPNKLLELEDVLPIKVLSAYVNKEANLTLFGGFNGLYKFMDNEFHLISDVPKNVKSIIRYKDSSYWLATNSGICLLNIDSGQTIFYAAESGLNSGDINSMVKSNANNLWIGNKLGVSKFDVENRKFTNYTYKNGFLDNEFINPYAVKLKSGKLFFGGLKGILSFDPKKISEPENPKKVIFTRLLINHEPIKNGNEEVVDMYIANTEEITIDHSQKILTLEFSTFEYAYPEKIKFSYMLEGYDLDWQTTFNRSLTYMNLTPGKYTLKIKGSNEIGDFGEHVSRINIEVLPAFWQTVWFKFLIILTLIAITYFLIDFVFKRERDKRNHEYEKKSLESQKVLDENQLRFFTNLSHEIRTPLSLIISPVRTIIDSNKIKSEDIKSLHLVEKSALRIERLITRGIDFRRTLFKEPELKAEHIEIVQFLKDLIDVFSHLSTSKNISLRLESNVEEQMIWFDKFMLETIFYNLLSNAFKYSYENGEILLSIVVMNNKIQIYVKDFGIGISDDDSKHIFERFFQSKNHIGGSGIGLALTKRFVKAHKGVISVKSTLGEGSCFKVELFLGKEHISKENIKTQTNDKNLVLDASSITIEENDDLSKEENEIKMFDDTLLVVEDEDDLREYLSRELSKTYNVLSVNNGREALDIISKNKIDLIVSDVMMPIMDGFELCSKLKEVPKTSSIPIILLTAKSLNLDKIVGYESGADEYITKPFDFKLLLVRIKNLLGKRVQNRKLFLESIDINLEKDSVAHNDKLFAKKCMSIMENNLSNPNFNVTSFTQEIGMSKSLAYKKLNQVFHLGINDLMLKLRMNKASQLLIHSSKSIVEIAILVGFKNTKYFSTSFKKNFGNSPLNYRAEQVRISKNL